MAIPQPMSPHLARRGIFYPLVNDLVCAANTATFTISIATAPGDTSTFWKSQTILTTSIDCKGCNTVTSVTVGGDSKTYSHTVFETNTPTTTYVYICQTTPPVPGAPAVGNNSPPGPTNPPTANNPPRNPNPPAANNPPANPNPQAVNNPPTNNPPPNSPPPNNPPANMQPPNSNPAVAEVVQGTTSSTSWATTYTGHFVIPQVNPNDPNVKAEIDGTAWTDDTGGDDSNTGGDESGNSEVDAFAESLQFAYGLAG
ncbi:MAG: hypothetical protein M1838_003307 [Thelocarpon superellum]|nr:MAG: hypothetical protein M1838_003307 [Thelocarpon superellum]